MVQQRGLVEFEDAGPGQIGITAVGSEQQQGPATMGQPQGILDPFFQGTRWTHDDVRTITSFLTMVVAALALWELARG